nr:hemolysin III family protein [uncultured Caproiciproducens sp.]
MNDSSTNKSQWRATRRKELELPSYTMTEEIINAITHGVGAGLAIAGFIALLINGHHDIMSVTAVSIFGVTMILLYTVSAIYHGLDVCNGKKICQILDHCTIFLLIAGTYTPIALLCFGGMTGWIMFDIVWAVAIVGIVLNAIDLKRFKTFSMICYLALGWFVVFFLKPLIEHLDRSAIFYLIIGGVFYTVGAVIYGLGKKIKYMHSIWHLFVLGGTVFHYFVIYHIAV